MHRPQSKPDPESALRSRAIALLARREHSRAELVRKLGGEDAALLEPLLDDLAANGLQSDARFTEQFITSRVGRGNGPLRIRRELYRRGVAAELVDAALSSAAVDWLERLEAARCKRFGAALPGDRREQGRQARFLAQRGFTSEQIRIRLTDAG